MDPYEQWLALCRAYDEAELMLRAAVDRVTHRMHPDAQGNPSHEELHAFDAAKEALHRVKSEMSEFMAKHFTR